MLFQIPVGSLVVHKDRPLARPSEVIRFIINSEYEEILFTSQFAARTNNVILIQPPPKEEEKENAEI